MAEQTIQAERMEQLINVFGSLDENIKIIEHFQLSEQYTLKNLLDVYWSSILTEFHRYSLLEYNLLRQAKVDVVEENTLRISLEDSVLAHQKEEEIYHILEKIFNERCNLSVQIQMEFHEKKESKYRKNADLKMQNEVENVIRLSSFGIMLPNPLGLIGREQIAELVDLAF